MPHQKSQGPNQDANAPAEQLPKLGRVQSSGFTRHETIPGLYEHYKGRLYWVLGEIPLVDKDENSQWVVLYIPLYGDFKLHTRTHDNFHDLVQWPDKSGYVRPRFQLKTTALNQSLPGVTILAKLEGKDT